MYVRIKCIFFNLKFFSEVTSESNGIVPNLSTTPVSLCTTTSNAHCVLSICTTTSSFCHYTLQEMGISTSRCITTNMAYYAPQRDIHKWIALSHELHHAPNKPRALYFQYIPQQTIQWLWSFPELFLRFLVRF